MLVSAPWALFNRPSLPLGSLKAYLLENVPGIRVQSDHLYVVVAQALGYASYRRVSQRVWRAESVYSALLYPDRASRAESLFLSTFPKKEHNRYDFKVLVQKVRAITDRWINTVEWSALKMVGLSISFCQVTASLYLISQIKRICPSLPVVIGGSSFSGEASTGLLKAFPNIDYLVLGEGERPLSELVRYLCMPQKARADHSLPESIIVSGTKPKGGHRFCQLERLARLPVPDYDDYFGLLAKFPAAQRFFPTLPLEASRGCWWHRRDRRGQFAGCAFCNLNLQWQGYRIKSSKQVVEEVKRLVQRYQVLSLAFADNTFPLNKVEAIFQGMTKLGYDLSVFAELRANTTPSALHIMKQAGVDTVQVGIESLSTGLLEKMNKGARAIDNLSIMKHCEAAGIACASNLLLHFPSSDEQDVNETLWMLDFCRWYRPLKTVGFWLGLQSPVYRYRQPFQIRSAFNHPNLKKLFPPSIAGAMHFIIQGYRGDKQQQRRLWRPVENKVAQWQADYAAMQTQTGGQPSLMVREGGPFLIIDQHFPNQPVVKHRLTGASATIYRYCDIPRQFDQICNQISTHGPEQIQSFLSAMVDKRLMVAENNFYLSLAMPAKGSP